jgi:uncharacterized protein YfiM (DUF2279 family)
VAAALASGLTAAAMATDSSQFPLFPDGAAGFPAAENRSLSIQFGPLPAADGGTEATPAPEEFQLGFSQPFRGAVPQPALPAAALSAPAAPKKPLLSGPTLYMTLGVIAAVPVVGELVWWKGNERGDFHFVDEGWFGEDTYAGGADKVSHFFFGYMAGTELSKWYQRLGNSPKQSRMLAVGLASLGGALIELGDGMTEVYGYSWGDVAANFAGALAAAGIEAGRVDDLVGMRFGFVPADIPPPCCRAFGFGHDYSEDVYSLDFKIAGAFRRAGKRPGPAAFFLVSLTYGTKGYRFSPPEVRERNIGIDLGLNMPEILLAIGVPKNKWWGEILLTFFKYVRLPYTAFGFQYDLNSGTWHGPSTGDKFDPGLVIYP